MKIHALSSSATPALVTASASSALWTEILLEWRKCWRQPAFALPALLFPVMFYVLFAVLLARPNSSYNAASWLLASYGAFGVIGPGLFAFGIGIALERDQGYLKWRLTLAAPLHHYFLAKMLVALAFAVLIVVQLLFCAAAFAGFVPSAREALSLSLVLSLGSLPFSAIGLAFGAWLRGNVAPGVLNGLYLPTSALSGLWFPLFALPAIVQKLAWLLPPFHLGQLAQAALGRPDGHAHWHVLALLLTTVVALWLARRGLQRKPF